MLHSFISPPALVTDVPYYIGTINDMRPQGARRIRSNSSSSSSGAVEEPGQDKRGSFSLAAVGVSLSFSLLSRAVAREALE
jgi:hypothetical protein